MTVSAMLLVNSYGGTLDVIRITTK